MLGLDICELLGIAMDRHHGKVTLLPFPREDETFAHHAARLLDRLDGAPDPPQRLQDLLRAEYPNAAVWPRSELAAVDDSSAAWYVYRDGNAMPHADATSTLHAGEALGADDQAARHAS
jgi:hypothetical protein